MHTNMICADDDDPADDDDDDNDCAGMRRRRSRRQSLHPLATHRQQASINSNREKAVQSNCDCKRRTEYSSSSLSQSVDDAPRHTAAGDRALRDPTDQPRLSSIDALRDRRYAQDSRDGSRQYHQVLATESASVIDGAWPSDCRPLADHREHDVKRRPRISSNDAMVDHRYVRTGDNDSRRPPPVTAAECASSPIGGCYEPGSTCAVTGQSRRWQVGTGRLLAIGIILCVVVLLAVLLALLLSNGRPELQCACPKSASSDHSETTPFVCEACEQYTLET